MPGYLSKMGQIKWSKDRIKYLSLPPLSSPTSSQDRASLEDGPEVGLLEKEETATTTRTLGKPLPIWRNGWFMITHIALFTVYVIILFLVASSPNARFQSMPFSPARDYLTWQETVFTIEDHLKESPYTAEPGPSVDLAWHNLLENENMLIERNYVQHYNKLDTAIEVPEGGMYLGTLNVYHEIHCLKRLYQYMYPEYYFSDLSEAERDFNRLHNAHCIEFLRQSAMCHGDIGLILYSWHPDVRMPVANATSHQCVDWDRLMDFTSDRSVDIMKPGWLVHPTRGPAFPDGEGDKVGAPEELKKGHQHGH